VANVTVVYSYICDRKPRFNPQLVAQQVAIGPTQSKPKKEGGKEKSEKRGPSDKLMKRSRQHP
jgi:hypothetical protein